MSETTTAVTWRPTPDGIQQDGTIGGDGAGESVSIRYVSDQAPNARVTSYYYVVDRLEQDGTAEDDATIEQRASRYYVDEQTVYFVSVGDEDDTEAWSDVEYGEGSVYAYADEDAATRCRDNMARRELNLAGHVPVITWNGEPA